MAPVSDDIRLLLQNALDDDRALVRVGAARGLWRSGVPAQNLLPTLGALLHHKLASVRVEALMVVTQMGTAALPLRSDVEHLAADENNTIRKTAKAAMKSIEGRST
jgi:hypothetical protein